MSNSKISLSSFGSTLESRGRILKSKQMGIPQRDQHFGLIGSGHRPKTSRYFQSLSLQAELLNIWIVTKREPNLRQLIQTSRPRVNVLRTKYNDQLNKFRRTQSLQPKSRLMHHLEEANPQKTMKSRAGSEESKQFGFQSTLAKNQLKSYKETNFRRRLRLKKLIRRACWAIYWLRKLTNIISDRNSYYEMRKSISSFPIITDQLIKLIKVQSKKRANDSRRLNPLKTLMGTRIRRQIDIKGKINLQNQSSPRSLALDIDRLKFKPIKETDSILSSPNSTCITRSKNFRYIYVGRDFKTEFSITNLEERKRSIPLILNGPKSHRQPTF